MTISKEQLPDERLVKILSETQATINEHNLRQVRGSVEVDARLFESMLAEIQLRRHLMEKAESVGFRTKLKPPAAIGCERWDYKDHRQPDDFELETCVIERLYTAPQPLTDAERAELHEYRNAQQVVPEWTNEQCLEFLSIAFRHAEIKGDLEMDDIRLGVKMVNACRAAMQSGAVKDGWVMVPVEPTEGMIIAGFEAELREEFRDPEAWEAFEAMSGCEQAAQLAKWCWAAMIAAAPQQEAE